jgi:O-antigen/teichoic acid export membrane protein
VGGQFFWVSGGRVVAALIQAAIMLLLVRAVSPSEFGFFAAVYGVMTVAQTFFDFGLPTLVIRERARQSNAGIVTAALRLNNSLSVALGVLLVSVTAVLGLLVDERFFLLLPLGVWAAAERNADAWLGVIFADGDARVNTLYFWVG